MKALIALDDSEHAVHTLAAVGGWATNWNVEANLLTVVKPGAAHATASSHDYTHALTPAGTASGQSLYNTEPLPGLAEDRTQALVRMRAEQTERLDALASEYLPLNTVKSHVERAEDVPQAILDKAVALGVDVIVVGTHGRTGLGHAIMGSVAEKVVRLSPVPVVVVGPKVGQAV